MRVKQHWPGTRLACPHPGRAPEDLFKIEIVLCFRKSFNESADARPATDDTLLGRIVTSREAQAIAEVNIATTYICLISFLETTDIITKLLIALNKLFLL